MTDKVVVVKQRRGRMCCGTGCAIPATIPLSVVGIWELLGAIPAIALWPFLIAGAHALRLATGTQKRYLPPRR